MSAIIDNKYLETKQITSMLIGFDNKTTIKVIKV